MPDDRGCYRLSVWHVEHERDRPAVEKIDLFIPISRSHQHLVLFERYLLEVRGEQSKVRWRQRSQQSVANGGMTLHHGNSFPQWLHLPTILTAMARAGAIGANLGGLALSISCRAVAWSRPVAPSLCFSSSEGP